MEKEKIKVWPTGNETTFIKTLDSQHLLGYIEALKLRKKWMQLDKQKIIDCCKMQLIAKNIKVDKAIDIALTI